MKPGRPAAPAWWPAATTALGVLLADARRHRLQTLTSLLGVAAGVAVVVAIHLASRSSLQSFQATYGALAGKATHQLTAVGPLSAARLGALAVHPAVRAIQPVIESSVVLPQAPVVPTPTIASAPARSPAPAAAPALAPTPATTALRTLRLVGIDPFLAPPFYGRLTPDDASPSAHGGLLMRFMTEPGLALLATEDLARLGLADGDPLTVRGPAGAATLTCVASAALSGGDTGAAPFALVDIATAQEVLGLGDALTRIDLILSDAEAALPLLPGEVLERPAQRGERAGTLTRAFRLNLMALGFLAVLVGAFLVFNMSQFAVTRRRTMLGKLRCLGCSAKALLAASLGEAMVLGLAGGVLGLACGRLLAAALVDDVALTVSTLYGHIETPSAGLDGLTAVGALVLAVITALVASWGPARSAASTPPAVVAGAVVREQLMPARIPLGLLVIAVLLLLPPEGGLLLQSLSVLCLLLGVAMITPRILGRLVRHAPRGTVTSLAAGRLQRSLSRTGAAAGALVMPIAMTVGITVMIDSFQREVTAWVDATIGADIYVSPLYQQLAPRTARLDTTMLAALEAWPGVTGLDLLRGTEQRRGAGSFLVAGARLSTLRMKADLRILQGESEGLWERLEEGAVLITEPLQRKSGLEPGDTIELLGRDGPRSFPIAAVFQDFSYDRGYCLMEESHYLDHYGETGVRNAALLLDEGVDAAAVSAALANRFPDGEFKTTEGLRAAVMEAFDNTFRVTWSLQAISTALALVGVLTGLLCLHLERRHELGVLRSLGATHRTIGRLLLAEALVIVGLAVALAVPLGGALAWILIALVNTRSFGWSFPMVFDPAAIASVLGLAIVAALLAGMVPWLLVRRARIARLLHSTAPLALAALLLAPAAAADDGFLRALPGRPLVLPADHGAHPTARTEWWYLTGPLEAETGEVFGFQATWFRRALVATPIERASPLGAQAVMMFHGNLTDLRGERMLGSEQACREYGPWASADTDRLALDLLGHSLVADDDHRTAVLDYRAGDARVQLTLALDSTEPLLHGNDEGLSPKGDEPGQASWYYSLPRISARGTVTLPGREPLAVQGTAWFDHEFGSSVLSDEQVGWDWFSVPLDNGSELMLFELRRAAGAPDDDRGSDDGVGHTRDRASAGTLRHADGRVVRLTAEDFSVTVTRRWTSPSTGITYPAGWRLSVPGEGLELTVRPLFADQEVTTPDSTSVTYWEGLCEFSGRLQEEAVSGRGYGELVGYGAPFSARF